MKSSLPPPPDPHQQAMTIILNGESHELEEGSGIEDLLKAFKLLNNPIVVELDGRALTRRDYKSATLSEGSRVEVIRLAAGG